MGTREGTAEMELRAITDLFGSVADSWRLSRRERAELLGDGDTKNVGVLDRDAEHRMRLVVAIDALLAQGMGRGLLLSWLRDPDRDGVTPLAFMSASITHLRAMRVAGEVRFQRIGEHRVASGSDFHG